MRIKLLILSVVVFLGHSLQAQIKQVINPIQELEATDRLWVTVVPSDKNEMVIDGELADKVETVLSEDKIRLKMKAGYYLKGNQASVIIYCNTISTIIARKGAEINVEKETLASKRMNFTANGGAKIRALISTSN
ncbi:MAG: GIN domain-containing protein, partial [Sphingobacterium sp.]